MAMQDVYDFFFDVNSHLLAKGLQRLDDMLRPAIMSGLLSDMLNWGRVQPRYIKTASGNSGIAGYTSFSTAIHFERRQLWY